jgi:hypothetical protein
MTTAWRGGGRMQGIPGTITIGTTGSGCGREIIEIGLSENESGIVWNGKGNETGSVIGTGTERGKGTVRGRVTTIGRPGHTCRGRIMAAGRAVMQTLSGGKKSGMRKMRRSETEPRGTRIGRRKGRHLRGWGGGGMRPPRSRCGRDGGNELI